MSALISRRGLVTAAGAMTLAPHGSALAQAWPTKPIRWVVPYTAGGLTDVVTRLTLQHMDVGQPFVVDNKPGANSLIAAEFVAKAAPDGYTFITLLPAHVANVTLYAGKLNFDPLKAFVPITLATSSPLIICTSNELPVTTVGELISYAKKNPGKISYGSTGIGAAAHLTTELMKQVTGTDMVHVPYKGTAPALADLASGNIQLLIDVPIGVISQIRAGKIRGLALMSKERVAGIEEIPTIVESGGPLIEASSWAMFLAPAGTPATIVENIAAATRQALQNETLRKRLLEQAVIPIGASPAEAATFFDTEVQKWRQVIETAKVKINS